MRPLPGRLHLACILLALLSSVARTTRAQDASAAVTGDAGTSSDAASSSSRDAGVILAPTVLSPPVCIAHGRPVYPADGDGRRVDVDLLLTVDEHGTVVRAEVLGHIPPDAPESFDIVAREAALRDIRFTPASRGGQPIMVRVRYHMAVAPPLVALDGDGGVASNPDLPEEAPDEIGGGTEGIVHSHAPHPGRADAGSTTDAGVADSPTPSTGDAPLPLDSTAAGSAGATVRGAAVRGRNASEWVIPVSPYANIPRLNGTEILTLAPGIALSNEGGEGHAQNVYLRGFTGTSGQDIGFTLDGIPLNEESNTHGQGYVDLYFIMPELVQRLDVTEGVADPRQGNFSVAGSVNYHLGLRQRGVTLRGAMGMYGYQRFAAMYGAPGASDESFVGVDYTHSNGFGPARNYDRASGIAQHEFDLGGGTTARVMAALYASRWASPGVIRRDDLESGRIGFFDTYAAGGRQGGFSTRALVAGAIDWRRERERAEMRIYAQLRDLTINENFTGFVNRRVEGDLIEQRYSGGTVGANGFYQRDVQLLGRAHAAEIGWFFRHDRYTLGQRRLDALTNLPPSNFNDPTAIAADVHATNAGLYVDATARPLDRLTLRGGVRVDAMAYAVDANVFRTVDLQFQRTHRTAFGVHVGPKATAELNLGRGLVALASAGTGFRSPDALTLADGETAPFTSVNGQELGVRYALPALAGRSLRVSGSLAGYHTLVTQDLLFDPTVGRNVPIGPTRRLGAALWLRVQPLPWIDINASLTYTRATVESDALGRTIPAGSLLPYVPEWVGRIDAAADRQVGTLWQLPLRVRAGLGMTYYSPRPLPLDERSAPVFLLDASAGARLGPVELGLSARNLLDSRWNDAELNFASNFRPGTQSSLFPERHFAVGAPFSLYGTLTLYL